MKSSEGNPLTTIQRQSFDILKSRASSSHTLDSLHFSSDTPQQKVSVAYLGPRGTYTHQAAIECFQSSAQHLAVNTIADIFDSVKHKDATFGLAPVENSTNGSVAITLDLFRDQDELYIWNETYLRVSHCLLGTSDTGKVKRLYSHPQASIWVYYTNGKAFGQCELWLSKYLPGVNRINTNSTSQAAQAAELDPEGASISSMICADIYNLRVLAMRIQDSDDNTTRFFVISKSPNYETEEAITLMNLPQQKNFLRKTILRFTPNPMKQMAVSKCLLILTQFRVLSVIIRPSLKKDWHYVYFAELEGELSEENLRDMELLCVDIRVLGSFWSRFTI
ncbi:P-protein [Neolecta irregularis DAH-3]|uniref:prephenate dehydratase n=1 Tax=Neolecta irregularis (strain DAH-3) TaxID=1198029 RepID=A0A1U7LJP2_NEOID|nr:P-protein [Neolecta irregularis DAH-3]|eukprot:OLL22875.1 P-protein [Neolecta irregularis DAH-3]